MTLEEFTASVADARPPVGVSAGLVALWHDARGDWHAAHEIAQDVADPVGAWVHAYLHRKEGDASNAAYWYRRAGKPVATASLDDEWAQIATALLGGTL